MCKELKIPTVCICGHRPPVGTSGIRCERRRGVLRGRLAIRGCPDFEEVWRPEQVINGIDCHGAESRLVPRNYGFRYSQAAQGPSPLLL